MTALSRAFDSDVDEFEDNLRNDRLATAPTQQVDAWSIKFSDIDTGGFGTDSSVPGTTVPGAHIAPYTPNSATGPAGVSPVVALAVDNTLGSFSPYQGTLYVAYTAAHWPIQAPEEEIAPYKGKYDAGYDAIRQQRIAKLKRLGLMPPVTEPAPPTSE